MTSLTKLSLANRLIVGLVTLAIVVFGVLATLSLKQELLPSTQIPTAMVIATYPGTSPELVATDVAEPLEQALGGVKGVTKVRSTSSNGIANLTVEWAYGLDSDTTVAAIRNAADSVRPRLPAQTDITVRAGSTDDIPVLALAVSSDAALPDLAQSVDNVVVPALTKVDGVRQVVLSGENTTELAVTLKPAQLRKHDLTTAALTQVLRAQALVVPAGTSYSKDTELAIQVGQTPSSAQQVAAWSVPTADGPVALGSLATVKVTSVDATTIARSDGRPALSLTVLKDSDADAVKISHAVLDAVPGLERSLGGNATIATVFDQAPLIVQSIHDLAVEGGLGLGFAVLVILVFLLSVRSTIITAISIPLSLLIAMIGLQAGSFSLNIFTLAALTVAVGRVVDDSIVVTENIKRRATGAASLTPGDIVASVKEVAGAVTASTLTTVAVFLPVALVSGVVGELFRPFALTIAVALVASLLVSMTIVPVLAYWFLRPRRRDVAAATAQRGVEHDERKVTRLQRGYLPILAFALRRPVIVLVAAALIFGGTLASATLLKTDFLGSVADKTAVQISQKLPVGTRLSATSDAAGKVEDILAATPGVTSYLTTVGAGGSNSSSVIANVGNEKDWDAVRSELTNRFAERPDLGEITLGSVNTQGSTSALTVTVTGDDEAKLRTAAGQVQSLLTGTPGVKDVTSDLAEERPVLQVNVDKKKAAAQGFTQSEIGQAISDALRGTQVGSVVLAGQSRDIMVRSQASDASPASIKGLVLPVSQLQQQKAQTKASDKLTAKQAAATKTVQREADQATADQRQKLVDQRAKAVSSLAKTRKQLAQLKASPPPAPAAPAGPVPAGPAPQQPPGLTATQLAARLARQQWAQQVAQLTAEVTQADDGITQLDQQLTSLTDQVRKSADQRAQQTELSDQQKALADVRATPLTVADLAAVTSVQAPSTVTHIDGTRAVTVSGTPDTSDLGALTKTLQTKIDALDNVPPGVTVALGGASQDQQDAFRQLGLAMLLAIVLVFLIMVATFRSLAQPLVLLISIPFAATGAVAALLLTDTALGVPSMVGLLMLIGIVVTNAIVLIDLINKYREQGEDLTTAVTDGARLRLRPIIMTATATIFALIPMGLGLTGGGAFISRPLAVVVIGGLVSSTLLTLVLVPVLYSLVERRGERRRVRALEASAGEPTPA